MVTQNTPAQGRERQIIITIKENKFDASNNPGLLSYATTYFENSNLNKR